MKLLIVLGVVVLLGGVSIILSAFHIHFPLARVAVGFAFAWVGVSLLLSAAGVDQRWMAVRAAGQRWGSGVVHREASETGVVFGNDVVDVTDLQPGEHRKVSVVFSDVTLRYDPDVPLEVHSSTVFGKTVYPDGASLSFGDRFLPSHARADQDNNPPAHLELATVFGNTRFVPVAHTAAAPAE